MSKSPKQMSKARRAMYAAVLQALKAHDCIRSYEVSGQEPTVEWEAGGFDRALEELSSRSPRPFGLKKGSERAGFLMVLAAEDKQRVDAILLPSIMEEFGRQPHFQVE